MTYLVSKLTPSLVLSLFPVLKRSTLPDAVIGLTMLTDAYVRRKTPAMLVTDTDSHGNESPVDGNRYFQNE